eukprot:CAMPEP_0194481062 /NCGR_PEP_ID=MMETSP0253-20130528/3656_1 /TAXON_ID=2966 /ORGANISM="Noctiluca scintillans" /LENGTH=639 /DNA_ID=CAMNT_0039320525 /DNA_START=154 /DNA_END=2073 /DNA_ORIENTATION=-
MTDVVLDNATDDILDNTTDNMTDDMADDVHYNTTDNMTYDMADDVYYNTTHNMTDDMADDLDDNTTHNVTDVMADDHTTDNMTDVMADDIDDNTTDNMTDDIEADEDDNTTDDLVDYEENDINDNDTESTTGVNEPPTTTSPPRTSGGIAVDVLGQSGKFTLYKEALGKSADPDAVTVTMSGLYELDEDGEEVGTSGSTKHSINTFAAQDFTVEDAVETSIDGVPASLIKFSSSVSTIGQITVDTWVIESSGTVGPPNETWSVIPGDIKWSITLSDWTWCGCSQGNQDQVGEYVDIEIEIKGSGGDASGSGKTFDLGGGVGLELSDQVLVDDAWMSMPEGFPLVSDKGNGQVFTFRFPKFTTSAVYDPLFTTGTLSSTTTNSEDDQDDGDVTDENDGDDSTTAENTENDENDGDDSTTVAENTENDENDGDDSTTAENIENDENDGDVSTTVAESSENDVNDENDGDTGTTVANSTENDGDVGTSISGSLGLTATAAGKETVCASDNLAQNGPTWLVLTTALENGGVSMTDADVGPLTCSGSYRLRGRRTQEDVNFDLEFVASFSDSDAANSFQSDVVEASSALEADFVSGIASALGVNVTATLGELSVTGDTSADEDSAGIPQGVFALLALCCSQYLC